MREWLTNGKAAAVSRPTNGRRHAKIPLESFVLAIGLHCGVSLAPATTHARKPPARPIYVKCEH